MTAKDVEIALAKHASDADAIFLQRFFKTGPGEYGEGDVFIGIRMPALRSVCKEFKDLDLAEIQKLISSPVHEHRMAGLVILGNQYATTDENKQQKIYEMYLVNIAKNINNWDLVDVTCEKVVGAHLKDRPRDILVKLARSSNLWERRVAMISTFAFIKQGDTATTIKIAKILLHDKHDLIQKAVGWMLREAGKRVDETTLTDFLDEHAHEMPRTQLRYSIEKLTPEQRQYYMKI